MHIYKQVECSNEFNMLLIFHVVCFFIKKYNIIESIADLFIHFIPIFCVCIDERERGKAVREQYERKQCWRDEMMMKKKEC